MNTDAVIDLYMLGIYLITFNCVKDEDMSLENNDTTINNGNIYININNLYIQLNITLM